MSLVRSLILTEARIAIDAEDRLVRIADMPRREIGQGLHHGGRQFEHWRLHFLVEDLFARLEPFALIVLLESAQERDSLRRKSAKTRIQASTSRCDKGHNPNRKAVVFFLPLVFRRGVTIQFTAI